MDLVKGFRLDDGGAVVRNAIAHALIGFVPQYPPYALCIKENTELLIDFTSDRVGSIASKNLLEDELDYMPFLSMTTRCLSLIS